jgi:tetratricopeptide (TPR) repeat protein
MLVGAQIGAAGAVQSLSSQEAAVGFVTNPLSPCPLRIQTTQQLIQQVPADVSVPTTYDALAVDPRCAPMINFASDLAIQSGELERADSLTLEGIEFDPLLDLSWILRARYLLAAGDVNGAQAALDEAVRVQSLYPETSEKTPTADLQAEIDAARG